MKCCEHGKGHDNLAMSWFLGFLLNFLKIEGVKLDLKWTKEAKP